MKYDGVTLVDQISIGGRFTVRDRTFGLINERISTHAEPVIFDAEKWRPKQDALDIILLYIGRRIIRVIGNVIKKSCDG
jgi:hypothetical protein